MRDLGHLDTTGGPVCITTPELAHAWTGVDGDYWELLDYLHEPEYTKLLERFTTTRGIDFLFFNTEGGTFRIVAGRTAFVIFEVVTVEEDIEVVIPEDGFAGSITDGDSLRVARLGGHILFFDSTLPGSEVALERPGVAQTRPDPDYPVPNTAMVEVDWGDWTASPFEVKTPEYHLHGIRWDRVAEAGTVHRREWSWS